MKTWELSDGDLQGEGPDDIVWWLDTPFGVSGNPDVHLCQENCGKFFKIHPRHGERGSWDIKNEHMLAMLGGSEQGTGFKLVAYSLSADRVFVIRINYDGTQDKFAMTSKEFKRYFIID